VPGRYVPARGDLVWLQLDPTSSHEQRGRRPALVVSPQAYNGRVGLALVCPVTTQVKGYPFEVALPGSSKVSGVILADQLKSLDWNARQAQRIEPAPPDVVEEVLAKTLTLLEGSGP
jgi:mRNA interferase MazF